MKPLNDPICSLESYLQSMGMDGPQTIQGIPTWMALTSVIAILFSTHLVAFQAKPTSGKSKWFGFNLTAWFPLKSLVKKNYFPLLVQSVSLVMLTLIIIAGLFGSETRNIGPVLTWTWWWALLIFMILGFGNVFCMVCPWEAMSSLVTSLSLRSRIKKLTYNLPWPRWANNLYPAIFLFLLLTWFELGNNVTHSASATAVLAMVMVGMAMMCAIVFERRAFCRHLCFVGRISGIYSLFSPVELRAADAGICATCTGKECFHGSATHTGCPTRLFPGNLKENTYCTLCTECIRACPHDNLGIRIRPFARDLFQKNRFQLDESMLAVILLALTSFHGLTMTPLWTRANQIIRVETGMGPAGVFTLFMSIMVFIPIVLFWGTAGCSSYLTKGSGITRFKIFKIFSYSLIPIALFYHLAHNCMHFFLEAGSLVPLLSDPFGWGWDLFGTASKTYGPMLSLETIWWLQVVCIVIGHVYGVLVADRLAGKLFPTKHHAVLGLIPLFAVMVLYSAFSIWLIAQPMDMRTAM